MNVIGYYSLFIGLGLAMWGCVAAIAACLTGDNRYTRSAERTIYGVFLLTLISTSLLIAALLRDDFTIKYVFQYSRRSQPLIYKFTALWGGMDGSLLLWCLLLALFSSIAIYISRKKLPSLPFSLFLLLLTLAFFLYLLFFKANPFTPLLDERGILVSTYAKSAMASIDGNGLNPLLQNAYMAIHPPMLYLGYVGFAIPFAFFLGGISHRDTGLKRIQSIRNWSLFSWLTLGIGIILGSYWAYIELGWGGYWGWDPVENASLVPWITGTALLHCLLMVEKRRMFVRSAACFVVSTFLLTLYGTYLTRSGVLQSVHAFGQEDPSTPWYLRLGLLFLIFIGIMLIISSIIFIKRFRELKSTSEIKSAGSKESIFLYSILLFAALAAVVLYGLTAPILIRIFTGKEPGLGPEFYVSKVVPVSLLVLILIGIASLAPWRKAGWNSYRKQLLFPATAAFFAFAGSMTEILLFVHGGRSLSGRHIMYVYMIICTTLAAFSATVILEEYVRMIIYSYRNGKGALISSLIIPLRENPRRYGSYIIHLGIIVFFLGAAFTPALNTRYQEMVKPGDMLKVGAYSVRIGKIQHDDLNADISKVHRTRIWTDVEVFRNNKYITTLRPQRVFYASNPEQPSYEVALSSSLMGDFYTVMLGFDLKKDTSIIGFFINPMVEWLWLGGILILLGGLLAFIPLKRR